MTTFKKVQFPLEYQAGTKLIEHPDDITLFTDSTKVNGVMYANYSGLKALESQPKSNEVTEREWQESELLRTDNWPKDRPPVEQVMLDYRQELRDYNNQPDFPNGVRPVL